MSTPKVSPPAVIDKQQRYSYAESFATLRISPAQGYKEIKSGRLKVIREGRRGFVHGTELIRRLSVGVES